MKRKYINRMSWARVTKGKSVLINKFSNHFNGYGSAIFIDKVNEPLMCKIKGHEIPLADNGYTWIQRLPMNVNYAITTMFDENNNIIQWYIDITKQNSINDNSEPFYDDLYLDVVIFPNGDIFLLDEDELEEALDKNIITIEDYDLAYFEANKILNGLAKDISDLLKLSLEDLSFFKQFNEYEIKS